MLSLTVFKNPARKSRTVLIYTLIVSRRNLHYDGRNRLSNVFLPTQRRPADRSEPENAHDLLIRAGFLRQAHAGIFHLLPLGLRIQNKIERLIDKHMLSLGASKVSLSSLSSEELWQRSGRLDKGRSSELLRLEDRKGAKYLLSPTHEEEITTIIANAVHSYKELPLRLYQVSRKYRDEPRPRQGLLRGREFLMKDLYTFDATESAAIQTYEDVRKAYVAFLDELKLPYLVARADSGNMGGTLSHEYHFATPQGEDTIISCDKCEFSINEELYIGRYDHNHSHPKTTPSQGLKGSNWSSTVEREDYISKDRTKLCSIHYLAEHGEPSVYAIKGIFPDLDPGLHGEQAREVFRKRPTPSTGDHRQYRDPRLSNEVLAEHTGVSPDDVQGIVQIPIIDGEAILLTRASENDICPNCKEGKLKLRQAIEIGHTFHLGTRYSNPLEAQILGSNNRQVPIEMGCHGIGVSRLIGAVAALLADVKGLSWPLAISPFEVVVVAAPNKSDPSDLDVIYDLLALESNGRKPLDVVIDDRERPIGWKLNDADLIGYPFILVIGSAWRERQSVELQCRRLGLNVEIPVGELVEQIHSQAQKL